MASATVHQARRKIKAMKHIIPIAVAGLAAAAPAQATGGLICSTAGSRPIRIALVISHTVVPAVVSARMTEGGRDVPVITAQSWFDPSEVRVDLVDRNAMRHELRLRAGWRPTTRSYDGSLWRGGKRSWVRCREG
jgi:hypothetical protein